MYLIDTSVLTRLRKPGVVATLLELNDVLYSPMSGLEYRHSASNAAEWDQLSAVLDGFVRIALDPRTFDRADEVQRMLADRGLKGRKPPDLVIAAQAELAKLTIVHYDRDVEHIATVTGQKALWISAPGSID